MSMTTDQWDSLVHRRVQQAKQDPRGYRIRVAAWAVAGYAVLLAALGLAIASIGGLVVAVVAEGAPVIALKLGIPILVVSWILMRSLFVKVPPPSGIALERSDAPELFASIDLLRKQLDTPRLHRVLLDGDFNASIVQIPRLGPLGWQRNYLTLGLACMQALSKEELEAVLAHELGHISRSHGRFGVWIYRVRNSWASVALQLDERGFAGSGLAERFYGWYVPRLQACSVALMREHEHEADRAAAQAVGARPAALALVRTAALAPAIGGFWDGVYARVVDEPQPPREVYRELVGALQAAPAAAAATALQRELATPTDPADSHPSLSERLAVLGLAPESLDLGDALRAPDVSAADALFGREGHAALCDRLGSDWHGFVQAGWSDRHAAAAGERLRLHDLDVKAAAGALDAEAARERAILADDLRDEAAALAAWRDVIALAPADAPAHLVVGMRLLARDDDAGLGHIDRAIAGSPPVAARAAEVGYGYLAGRGRHEDAARYRAQMNAQIDVLGAAAAERRAPARGDRFDPHGLDPAVVTVLAAQFARIGAIKRAYVARKHVAHMSDEAPLFIVGVERAVRWWRLEGGSADSRLVARVSELLDAPGECWIVALSKDNAKMRKRLKRVEGALVYER